MRTRINSTAYRAAIGVALAAAFILVWLSLGVGIIGKDGDPANLMYFGVLAVGIIGAIIARLQPYGMARALFATALAQALVAVIALIAGLGLPWSGPTEIPGAKWVLHRVVCRIGLAVSACCAWVTQTGSVTMPEKSSLKLAQKRSRF
jgi:hypothetical protein